MVQASRPEPPGLRAETPIALSVRIPVACQTQPESGKRPGLPVPGNREAASSEGLARWQRSKVCHHEMQRQAAGGSPRLIRLRKVTIARIDPPVAGRHGQSSPTAPSRHFGLPAEYRLVELDQSSIRTRRSSLQTACGCWRNGRPACIRPFPSGRERPETPLHCWCPPDLSSCLRPCIPSLLLVHREVVNKGRAGTGRLGVLGGVLDDSDFHVISWATLGRY